MGIWRPKSLCNLIVPILILYLCLVVCSCQALEETLLTAASYFVPDIFPKTELHRIYDPIFAFDLICKLPNSHQARSRLLGGKSCLSTYSRLLKGPDQGCFLIPVPQFPLHIQADFLSFHCGHLTTIVILKDSNYLGTIHQI